tara:strand:- start:3754 stop:3960 length:207 start_codon:yes stop_codon:yes gene_type:complete
LQNLLEDERKLEMSVKVISTECTEDQQKEDMPELVQMHAQALQADMMWEFFGGMLTLPNGHRYQVINI